MTSQTLGSRLRHAWNAFLNRDPPGKIYIGEVTATGPTGYG